MRKHYYLLGIFLIGIQFLHAQSFLNIDSINTRLLHQQYLFPQEKIYLHTDKPNYSTGEKIWFKAYLTNAYTLKPDSESQYVYTELLDVLNNCICRVKVKANENVFHGHIQIPDTLAEGNYTICSYTTLMRNSGEDYFYKKNVYISNPLIRSIEAKAEFTFNEKKTKVNVILSFEDKTKGEKFKPTNPLITYNNDDLNFKWDNYQNSFKGTIDLDPTKKTHYLYISSGNLKQYILIPDNEYNFDVSFFPEGGYLIDRTVSKIGFKALKEDGLSEDIQGAVYDENNKLISKFSSFHKGMGYFYLRPVYGKKYHAVCQTKEGNKRFDLPEVQKDAWIIKTENRKKEILVDVGYSPDNTSRKDLYLIVHSAGKILYSNPWNEKKKYIGFQRKLFPSGIIHFLLVDHNGNPLSEKLVLNLDKDYLMPSFNTPKNKYGTRDLIHAKIKIDKKITNSNISISVTDAGIVLDNDHSILTSLLLTSDLKGYIENPLHYFQIGNKEAQKAAEALMLTQGWKRYNLPEIIKGNFIIPETQIEIGQEIAGKVKSVARKKALAKMNVNIVSSDRSYTDMTETDQNGEFKFNGFDLPDNTTFLLSAYTPKGSPNVELIIEEEEFPENKGVINSNTSPFTNKTHEDFIIPNERIRMENGMMSVYMDEVVKVAPKKLPSGYSILANNSFTEEKIEEMGATNLLDILNRVAGVRVYQDQKVKIRDYPIPPLVVVDGVALNDPYTQGETVSLLGSSEIMPEFDYKSINIYDVERVDIFKTLGSAVIWGSSGAGGVISITTKKGEFAYGKTENSINYNMKTITPLGYQKPVEFYSSKYETPAERSDPNPDIRNTIYWNPDIKLSPSQQEIDIEFYSSDYNTDYRVVIEGITAEGELIHTTSSIEIIE